MNLSAKISCNPGVFVVLSMLAWQGAGSTAFAADDAKDAIKKPRIEFAETEHDVGTVDGEVGARHVFIYKNSGDAALTIKEVKSSCGCTVPTWSKEPLAPGTSGSIALTVHPVNIGGAFSKAVHVLSDDLSNADVPLTIKGTFALEVNWLPSPFVYMGNVVGSAKVVRTVDVLFEKPTKISEVVSTSPIFNATYKEIEPAKKYTVEISTIPPLQLGAMPALVKAHTDDPKREWISCTVSINVVESISCFPSSATFIRQGDSWLGPQLLVKHNDGGKFHVVKIETDLKGLQPKLMTVTEGSAYQILLEKPTEETTVPRDGEIVIYTDDAKIPVIKVPMQLR